MQTLKKQTGSWLPSDQQLKMFPKTAILIRRALKNDCNQYWRTKLPCLMIAPTTTAAVEVTIRHFIKYTNVCVQPVSIFALNTFYSLQLFTNQHEIEGDKTGKIAAAVIT